MRFLGKRGDSNIDLIISLAIFIVFLAWFFVFLRPLAEPKENVGSLSSIIERNILNSEWQVEQTKLFIYSNHSEGEAYAIEIPFNWSGHKIQFTPEREFAAENGILFIYAYASESPLVLVHSEENYSQKPKCKIHANRNFFTSHSLRGEMDGGLLESLSFDRKTLIHEISTSFNNVVQNNGNSSFSDKSIAALYTLNFGNTTSLYAAFCNSSELFYTAYSENAKVIRTEFALGNFTNYYINNEKNGVLSDFTWNASFITFYDRHENISISLRFSGQPEISFSSGMLSASLFSDKISVWMSPHYGNYTESGRYSHPKSYDFSVSRNESGLSQNIFASNSNTSFGSGFPATRNYFVKISCENYEFKDGNESISETDVYSKTWTSYLLYPNGTAEECNVQSNVW
jgi:hypothetical protein